MGYVRPEIGKERSKRAALNPSQRTVFLWLAVPAMGAGSTPCGGQRCHYVFVNTGKLILRSWFTLPHCQSQLAIHVLFPGRRSSWLQFSYAVLRQWQVEWQFYPRELRRTDASNDLDGLAPGDIIYAYWGSERLYGSHSWWGRLANTVRCDCGIHPESGRHPMSRRLEKRGA